MVHGGLIEVVDPVESETAGSIVGSSGVDVIVDADRHLQIFRGSLRSRCDPLGSHRISLTLLGLVHLVSFFGRMRDSAANL